MSKEEQQQHITSIGGQAVMEGVMMRGPFKTAVAVRNPDGYIECGQGGGCQGGEKSGLSPRRTTRKREVVEIAYNKRLREFCRQPCYRNESTYVQCGICRY